MVIKNTLCSHMLGMQKYLLEMFSTAQSRTIEVRERYLEDHTKPQKGFAENA
jgi:hypothetical protein